ncbi:BarA sensory histidine kinase (= VarS = GacS) [hydrothermal vent metagenome]|uniref:BarA sensory histidine kinase (= VarS = GacS) n=1 Tax=hydrothermal vent metagenome TaxID=652676 RepID=A0A3B1CMX1_9ZZZZ
MAVDLTTIHALVVDDYHSMRITLKEHLEAKGMRVTEAENGLEALEKIKETSFDIVFTDIVMPVMDGLEFCHEVKNSATLSSIPIVVLSTHTDASYLLKAINMGADDYVPKPIEFKLLDKVVARLIDA